MQRRRDEKSITWAEPKRWFDTSVDNRSYQPQFKTVDGPHYKTPIDVIEKEQKRKHLVTYGEGAQPIRQSTTQVVSI